MSLLLNSTAKSKWGFDPTSLPDCDIWFDAADISTLTLSGSTIKAWANKGSLSMYAVEDVGSSVRGLSINSLPYVSIPAGAQMAFSCSITSATNRSWFIVARCQSQLNVSGGASPTNWNIISRGGASSSADNFLFGRIFANSYRIEEVRGSLTSMVRVDAPLNYFNTVNLYAFVNSTVVANNAVTLNGNNNAGTITSQAASGYDTAFIKYLINSSTTNSGSDICEIIHYNRAVTVSERHQLEGYLMWKWGIKKFDESTFTPTSIPGCLAWFDSDIIFNDTTSREANFTFTTFPTVDVWKDKSGNGRHATFVSGTRPFITNPTGFNTTCKPFVKFNGGILVSPLSLSSTQSNTLFFVYNLQTAGTQAILSLNAYGGNVNQKLEAYLDASSQYLYTGGTGGTTNGTTASGTANTNVFDILAHYWAPSYTQMNVNGSYILSSTSSPASLTTGATMVIGGGTSSASGSTTSANTTNGRLQEIIVYDGLLTIDQRNRVERYLSLKWNYKTLLNSSFPAHPYKFSPVFSRQFVPTDISECSLWLDAADSSTITLSGINVTQWRDKSGNGKNATTGTGNITTSTTINNLNTFRFNGSSTLTISNFSVTKSQTCVFWVLRGVTDFVSGSYGYYVFHSNNFNDSGNEAFYAYYLGSSGTVTLIVRGFGGARAYGTSASPNPLLNNVTIASMLGNASATLNGTNQPFPAPNISFNGDPSNGALNTPSTYYLGVTGKTDSYAFDLAEIIVYNKLPTEITSSERQQLEGYLANKWGLRGNLPIIHPSYYTKTQIADVENFVPTSIAGCQLWIDPTDTSTINSGLITAGGTVTSLTDKSGNNISLAVNGTPVWDYLLNKLPSINLTNGRFNGAFVNTLTNFTNTTFIVSQLVSYPTAGYSCLVFANGSSVGSITRVLRVLDYATTFRSVAFFASTHIATTTASALATPFLWTENYNGSSPLNVLRNSGELTGTIPAASPSSNASHFSIGTDYSLSTTNQWTGFIGEIIVYNSVLSATDRIKVEKYLSRKWGTVQYTLAANRYYNPGAIPASPQILPTTISDIKVWLDAADPDGDGLAPSSGTKITYWMDKSRLLSQRAQQNIVAQRPTFAYDGIYPAIQFNAANSEWLQSSNVQILTSLNYGIFVVSKYTGSTSSAGKAVSFFDRKVNTAGANNYVAIYDYWNVSSPTVNVDIFYKATSPLTYKTATNTTLVGTRLLTEITDNSDPPATGQQVIYFNGTLGTYSFLNNSTASVATDAEGYRLGVSNIDNVLTNYFTGFIYEVIVITHTPTTQERQILEAYLAWKWGLNRSLPTTHPNYKVMP